MEDQIGNYSSLRNSSEDDGSFDSLLEKEQTTYQPRSAIWKRHKNRILVQCGLLAFYTVATFLLVAKLSIRSTCGHDWAVCKWSRKVCCQGADVLNTAPTGKVIEWQTQKFVRGNIVQRGAEFR